MQFLDYILSKKKYSKVVDLINSGNKNIYIGNCADNLSKILCAACYLKLPQNIIYITENIFDATNAFEIISDLIGADNVSFFPVEEFISSELIASSSTFKLARMQTLFNVVENNPKIIVTCTEGLTKCTMSNKKIKESVLKIKVGDIYPMDKLINDLVTRGYKKMSLTTEMGCFSVRGSIIDVYPINLDTVYRIDYFDDEIELIKKVDIDTQMSIERINTMEVFPLYDMFYQESDVESIINQIISNHGKTDKVLKDIERIKNYNSLDQLYIYLPYIDQNYCSLMELLNYPICIYDHPNKIINHDLSATDEINQYLNSVNFKIKQPVFKTIHECIKISKTNIFTNPNLVSLNDVRLDNLIDMQTLNCFLYNNNLKNAIEDIKLNPQKTYILTHFDDKKVDFLKEALANNEVKYCLKDNIVLKNINLRAWNEAYGFIDLEEQLEIITPHEFASGKIVRNSKFQKYYNKSTKIYSKDEITAGDYVIHEKYGVGMYTGIETRTIRGKLIDYIVIQYAGDSKLLLPVENITLLEKYNVSSGTIPKLNNMTGKDWEKKKAKVKEKTIEVAKRLIRVQAERELRQGFVYAKDTLDQMAFDADFEYTETVDQMKAINDVKEDMMSTKPVDRLICGDVGFGKTEIAMRAAFKAIENGKQVAYLAPTTVLTRQHYYSFKARFEKYGVKVELLNRFISVPKQKKIIEGLKTGYVDIIIGTHRILSNDIGFKDLGLLVIDEEQRFGVTHKEKIKEFKANVDVITLTATPIPRTLQMSLSGLRDLSLIETPPTNRLPIQTYVLEENESVIREAITRELSRNGQVFYLLNRVEELSSIANKVHRLCPFARVGIIHGQMDKNAIENTLIKFLDLEYDVLVCTTIIETGIDIPNANTLIIERADILGLAQLYQIRGRVGRSDRIAYAYLLYNKDKILTSTAAKRLEAIQEFTSLGSGYKIAMRDLAIRGAGDILGDEQSGFIDAVGIDLYTKLLQESINELKGIIKKEEQEKIYSIGIDRHVDSSYVSDDAIRVQMHKEIAKIRSRDQIKQLVAEYTDRYGKVTKPMLLYMEEKYLEFLLKSHGVEAIREKDDLVIINFDEEGSKKVKVDELFSNSLNIMPGMKISFSDCKIYLKFNPHDYQDSYIYTLTKFFENLHLQ